MQKPYFLTNTNLQIIMQLERIRFSWYHFRSQTFLLCNLKLLERIMQLETRFPCNIHPDLCMGIKLYIVSPSLDLLVVRIFIFCFLVMWMVYVWYEIMNGSKLFHHWVHILNYLFSQYILYYMLLVTKKNGSFPLGKLASS